MIYHICAFVAGFILDLIFGDPHFLYHPVIAIGKLISLCEKRFLIDVQDGNCVSGNSSDSIEMSTDDAARVSDSNRKMGVKTVIIVITVTGVATGIMLTMAYVLNPVLGTIIEAFMTYQILAAKSLKTESMKVYKRLQDSGIESARNALSMIVGRDTQSLDEDHVIAAAVETVAENTSDGVIAPMIYLAIGGPVLGLMYKAINTMDSMIGYKNDKYIDFGRCAAKLDDVVNFIPSRISAFLMIISCVILGKDYSAKNAFKIFKRDRFNHSSPNSAQTEAVCAGALGLRLAGDAYYFGKLVKKPYIGDKLRNIERADIIRANRLMYGATFLCEIICVMVMILFI